jgi:hypothetical protein
MRTDASLGAVDLSNPSKIFGRELKVEDIEIGLDPLWCHGFRDHRQIAVEMPADHHLRPALAVLRRKLGDRLVLIEMTATKRAPGLRDNSVLLVCRWLLEAAMLPHRWVRAVHSIKILTFT